MHLVEHTFQGENLLVHFRRIDSLRREALQYLSHDLNIHQLSHLELLLNRAYYPLEGFMDQQEYESVLESMRLVDNTLWPLPICLDIPESKAKQLEPGQSLALRDPEGFMLALMTVSDIWQPNLTREAKIVYGTDEPDKHPGVRAFLENTQPWYVGGRIEGLHLPQHFDFLDLRLSPAETHRYFSQRGWRNIIGVQTCDYPNCSHREMLLKAAREAGASIFLQPMVGTMSRRESEYFTRVTCYRRFMDRFPRNMIHMGLCPQAPRYAGPREALFQAIVQRNYGCTHVMVAEDHADPFADSDNGKRFYPRGKAQELVTEYSGETGISMIPSQSMVYVEGKAQYIPASEVSEDMEVKDLSHAELLRRLEYDLDIPAWYSFPEVVAEMRKSYLPRHRQGFTIFCTGLSGAGKSTLAKVLYTKFMELRDRPVTLLDGDIVRRNLSSELSFSKEHRNLNVTRIGYVASEITKNRGIAICAPIAPYEETRRECREIISRYGGYIQVYLSTPLDVCENRDRKGIYAKARAGIMKGVTGIDDPYEAPTDSELSIDTSQMTPTEAAQEVLLYLEEQGYII